MTPKECLIRLKKQNPDLEFDDLYFRHDQSYMFVSRPKGASPETSIGQIFAADPKTGAVQPFAPYGAGMDEFHRWLESARHQIRL